MTLPASGAISLFDVNDELGLSHSAQIGLLCTNVRTLFAVASGAVGLETGYGKSNTSVPGIPTGVSASATSSSAISVSFSAPACTGHLTIDYYQVVCTGSGTNSATGTSPISVTGLSPSTSYTFKVRAHNSKGYGCYSSSTGTATTNAARGCIIYTSGNGCYTFIYPSGVSRVTAMVVGGGTNGGNGSSYYDCACNLNYMGGIGGSGGGIAYYNNLAGTPGSSRVYIHTSSAPNSGAGFFQSLWVCTSSNNDGNAFWVRAAACMVCYNYVYNTGCGGHQRGGWGGYVCGSSAGPSGVGAGGGGAGGYNNIGAAHRNGSYTQGCGGRAQNNYTNAGADGYLGGGGGGNPGAGTYGSAVGGAGGGGVSLYGRGSSGAGGRSWSNSGASEGGGGGSGGNAGSTSSGRNGGNGGQYGGGGGGPANYYGTVGTKGQGAPGAVRLLWPGCSRKFPSCDVGV